MNKSIIWDLRNGLSVDDLRENRKFALCVDVSVYDLWV